MRTPEQRQVFINARLEAVTDTLNDRREQFLRFADELAQQGDSLALAHLLPRTALDYAEAFHKLHIAKAQAELDADNVRISDGGLKASD